MADNAEAMPFKDGWFDVVTCVYLFHELPKNARRNVLRDMLRVLRPGGLCVIEDSAQRAESPSIIRRSFHPCPAPSRWTPLRTVLRRTLSTGTDSAEMMFFLERFPEDFHEPSSPTTSETI